MKRRRRRKSKNPSALATVGIAAGAAAVVGGATWGLLRLLYYPSVVLDCAVTLANAGFEGDAEGEAKAQLGAGM